MVKILKSEYHMTNHQLPVRDYRYYHADYMSSYDLEAHASLITGWSKKEIFKKTLRTSSDYIGLEGSPLAEKIFDARPAFFINLKFDTLTCIANNCRMISGRSAIVFSHEKLKNDGQAVEKMEQIYRLGQT